MRFVWAQDRRLPADDADFVRTGTRMLLKGYQGAGDPDGVFPKSDTCFLDFTLPAYWGEGVRDRLLQAITLDADSMNADRPHGDDDDGGAARRDEADYDEGEGRGR